MDFEAEEPSQVTLPGEFPEPIWEQRRGPIAPREYVIPPGPVPNVRQRGVGAVLARTSPTRTPWGYVACAFLLFAVAFTLWAPLLCGVGMFAAACALQNEKSKPKYRRSRLPLLACCGLVAVGLFVSLGQQGLF